MTENTMTADQASALIQRADIVVSETECVMRVMKTSLRQAEDAHRQAVELSALVRQVVLGLYREISE